jgi:hypothetical protein
VCASINPGSRVKPPSSMTRAPGGFFTDGPTASIRSPRTTTVAPRVSSPDCGSRTAAGFSTIGAEAAGSCPGTPIDDNGTTAIMTAARERRMYSSDATAERRWPRLPRIAVSIVYCFS